MIGCDDIYANYLINLHVGKGPSLHFNRRIMSLFLENWLMYLIIYIFQDTLAGKRNIECKVGWQYLQHENHVRDESIFLTNYQILSLFQNLFIGRGVLQYNNNTFNEINMKYAWNFSFSGFMPLVHVQYTFIISVKYVLKMKLQCTDLYLANVRLFHFIHPIQLKLFMILSSSEEPNQVIYPLTKDNN